MTINTLFLRLGSLYVVTMIVVTFMVTALSMYNLQPKAHVDIVFLIFILRSLVAKYILANDNTLTNEEYWKIFVGMLLMTMVFNGTILAVHVSTSVMFGMKDFFMGIALITVANVTAILFGLWGAKRLAKKMFERQSSPVAVKVYTITDEAIADYLVQELSKHQIDAYFRNENFNKDPLVSPFLTGTIELFIRDNKLVDKALEIINASLLPQKNSEPWECPKCHTNIEAGFSACWNCGYEQ